MFIDTGIHLLLLGLKNILVHRLRSALTVLGIILGVASVIIMLAVGEAARFQALSQIEQLGATNIIVRSVKPLDKPKQSNQRQLLLSYGLKFADLEKIEQIPHVRSITPLREFRRDICFQNQKLSGRVVAVMPGYLEANGLKIAQGRWLTQRDHELIANNAVIGSETASRLFPFQDPIGKAVTVNNLSFVVVGVTEKRAASAGVGSSLSAQDYNRDIYIPFATDQARVGKMLFQMRAGSIEFEMLEMSQVSLAIDRIENVRRTAEVIQDLMDRYHPDQDVAVVIPLDLIEKAEQTQRLFTMVLGAIASISLMVGGIGIMNIMLATVTERTKEIGIRRALGAKQRDIIWQFLTETMVLSSAGGILGVALGVGGAISVNEFFQFPTILTTWSLTLAFAVSLVLGLLFGIYPAIRAAHMDPIEALRHE